MQSLMNARPALALSCCSCVRHTSRIHLLAQAVFWRHGVLKVRSWPYQCLNNLHYRAAAVRLAAS